MSDEEHSESEFYYLEDQETAERKARHRDRHFDKVEAGGNTGMKISSGCIDFRNKNRHIINYTFNLDGSVFTVKYKTSASV